jgi:hypothetical protein
VSKSGKWLMASAVILLLLLFALATDLIPGAPHARERNVTLYSAPHSDALPVSLFLQPPLATQVQGESQPISIQFTNHEALSAHVRSPVLESRCFQLNAPESLARSSPPLEFPLPPGATQVFTYQLKALSGDPECAGQHPLVISYKWWIEPATAQPATNPSAPTWHDAIVTSSPVEIVSAHTRSWERFFHLIAVVVAAVLLPVLLWFLNSFYQNAQARQDIWKAIFPGILILTQQHYLPILRRMFFLDAAIVPQGDPPSSVDCSLLLERVVLLRAQTQRLTRTFGGYHFRSKPGEELFGTLEQIFWFHQLFQVNSKPFEAISLIVETAFPDGATLGDSLQLTGPSAWKAGPHRAILLAHLKSTVVADTDKLNHLHLILAMLQTLLAFECDRPLYPEWYSQPPMFPYDEFKQQGEQLIAHKKAIPANKLESVRDQLNLYLKGIPKVCRITPTNRGPLSLQQ